MNLLEDRWIPVRRQNGEEERIAPWELTSDFENNPIVALAAPRPDFQGALMQFLIGLVQTAAPPDEDQDLEWEDWFEEPPSPEVLNEKFTPFINCFYLDGDGPRFMQDLELEKEVEKGNTRRNAVHIGTLLIDAPGENTLKNNADHFVKRGRISGLCSSCVATALFTLQTNAPAGGQGHRTSLRGGGPLTSLVVLDIKGSGVDTQTLWHNIWLNTLYKHTIEGLNNVTLKEQHHIFPWLAPTRTSEAKSGVTTYPVDVHPLQMYWGMPRRIRLEFNPTEMGICDLCFSETTTLVHQYITQAYGIDYSEEWQHTLSPYWKDKQGKPFPYHPQPGGFTYKYWLGLSEGSESDMPAQVVSEFKKKRIQSEREQLRLWVFGYDMDNMKPRNWYETTFPLYLFTLPDSRRQFMIRTEQMIDAAEVAAKYTHDKIRDALSLSGIVNTVTENFYTHTEQEFYGSLKSLHDKVRHDHKESDVLENWYKVIRSAAADIFDDYALREDVAFADMKQIVNARKELLQLLNGKKLRGILGVSNQRKEVTV